jgi:hypothetical protein
MCTYLQLNIFLTHQDSGTNTSRQWQTDSASVLYSIAAQGFWASTTYMDKGQSTFDASEIDTELHWWACIMRGKCEFILTLQLQEPKDNLIQIRKKGALWSLASSA